MPSIKLTLKNKEALEKYLKRFKKYSNTGLILRMRNDSFSYWGFGVSRAYIKYSVLSYKDVFNEAEIDIENDVYISFKEIQPVLDYLSKFQDGSTIKVDYDVLTDKGLLKEINKEAKGIPTPYESLSVASAVNFVSKQLKSKIVTKNINHDVLNFRMYDDKMEDILSEKPELLIAKVPVTKTDMSTIFGMLSLEKTENNSHLEIKLGGNTTTIKGNNFEYSLKGANELDVTDTSLFVNREHFNCIDVEDSEFVIKYHTPPVDDDEPIRLLVVKSTESETSSMVVTSNKP